MTARKNVSQTAPAVTLSLVDSILAGINGPVVAPAPAPAPKARKPLSERLPVTLSLLDEILAETHQADTPAPVAPVVKAKAVRKPRKRTAKATPKPVTYVGWARLAGGEWGIRAGVNAKPGDTVTTRNRKGTVQKVKLGEKSKIPGVFHKAGRKPKAKLGRRCIGNNNCRRLGWPKGSNCR